MEEKLKRVVAALDGVTYGEWQRIYTAINETYKKEADTIAREMTVPAIEKIRKVYASIYL